MSLQSDGPRLMKYDVRMGVEYRPADQDVWGDGLEFLSKLVRETVNESLPKAVVIELTVETHEFAHLLKVGAVICTSNLDTLSVRRTFSNTLYMTLQDSNYIVLVNPIGETTWREVGQLITQKEN